MNKYQLPVASWVESFTDWLTSTFAGLFSFLQTIGQSVMDNITALLTAVPPLVLIVLLTIAAFFISNKKIGLSLFTFIGLMFIYNQNLWNDLMSTVTLVLLSSVISIIIGVPLGILMAKSEKAKSIITPILDFMQTMPGFVYLIPAVAFFGIGMVPGVFASVIFALPPTVRFTNLGIRQVPNELVEAADSYGSTGWQKLFKLELPLAKNTIMAGVNQTTMLALSMVVIASMIGAPGLGRGVLSALQRAQVGNGFVNGVALVILAIIIDRFTQHLNNKKAAPKAAGATSKKKKYGIIAAVVVIVAGLVGASIFTTTNDKQISLSYVEWDTEVASTHVVAEVLKDMGYDVKTTPLDNAIMWESVAKGETELKELKLRIEDALNATRAAVEEGMVSGGGTALVNVIGKVAALEAEGDVATGIKIVVRALEEPIRQIAENAGYEGSVIVDKLKNVDLGIGFNAANGEWVNMVEAGIVDPTKVTRSALQNAASVSALLLTTEAVVADKPEPAAPAPMMDPSMGMGGMM